LKKALGFIDDVFLIAGISFLATGVYQIYPPAGYITLGICLIAGAYFYAQSR
jgi:hypothetical protein